MDFHVFSIANKCKKAPDAQTNELTRIRSFKQFRIVGKWLKTRNPTHLQGYNKNIKKILANPKTIAKGS